MLTVKPQSVKNFYFLEYFYILLRSVESYTNKEQVFNSFKILKQEFRLGQSRYKKLTPENEELTPNQMNKYVLTFNQVIDESLEYNLIKRKTRGSDELQLTNEGERLLLEYEKFGFPNFKQELFKLMENKYATFRYLVQFCYHANAKGGGLLIFPSYSPPKLHYNKSEIKTTADVIDYSWALVNKIQGDIRQYLEKDIKLESYNKQLLNQLVKADFLTNNSDEMIRKDIYYPLLKRFRDFWVRFFLQTIYESQYSMTAFETLTYRGKQFGILNTTAFYPSFSGKIVYPTSVVLSNVSSNDFVEIFQYEDTKEKMYLHKPSPSIEDEESLNKFIHFLNIAYVDLKKSVRGSFVNLLSVRELVCFKMKIAEQTFEDFLNTVYRLNLTGEFPVKISLEVDKLPHETKAMYLTQEPVLVEGKYRNIISIDFTRRSYE